jgi:trk system potassium uptake protein TrkH
LRSGWRTKRGDLIVRRPRKAETSPVEVPYTAPKIRRGSLSNPLTPLLGFALLILLGTLLLSLPFATVSSGSSDLRDALFTATSAVTVTGLVIVDTSTYWTTFGHAVILGLIVLGGLGIMTGATLWYLLFLRHHPITLSDSVQVSRSLGRFRPGDVVRLTRNIALVAIIIQTIGFLFVFARSALVETSEPLLSIAWHSMFHTVSAFNNAGFTISAPGVNFISLEDKATLSFLSILIILGSVSYFVLADVGRHRHRFNRFALNTKMVLAVSAVILIWGVLVFLLAEYNNPATLGNLSVVDKIVSAMFHSISGRTAGFSLIDFNSADEQTLLWYILLMFIGGASGSTAGGIKVTTVGILIAAVLASLTSRERVIAFHRELPFRAVNLALTVAFLSLVFVAISAILQTLWGRPDPQEGLTAIPFLHLLFETISAFGTNGLTLGVSGELSRWGQLFLVVTMFVGRLGPLTLALILVRKDARELYHYPQEEITIG